MDGWIGMVVGVCVEVTRLVANVICFSDETCMAHRVKKKKERKERNTRDHMNFSGKVV